MKSDAFEQVFEGFLESKAYDESQQILFDAMRAAFEAGWLAAQKETV